MTHNSNDVAQETPRGKHTPGPWHVSRDRRTIFAGGNEVTILGVTQNIPQIAYITRNGFGATLDEQGANTRLIAAAPDLLEACEEAMGALCLNPESCQDEINVSMGIIRAAIDKAKGTTAPVQQPRQFVPHASREVKA